MLEALDARVRAAANTTAKKLPRETVNSPFLSPWCLPILLHHLFNTVVRKSSWCLCVTA